MSSIEFETVEQVAEAMRKFDEDFKTRQSVVSTAVLQPFASALALLAERVQTLEKEREAQAAA
jgi:hypothetical protein